MKHIILALSLFFSISGSASENTAYLDAPYKNLVHPIESKSNFKSASRSDFLEMQAIMTPIRSQGSRGTCSIFSAIAMLESMLLMNYNFNKETLDLSEEWLEYLIMRNRNSDGSNSWSNFNALRKYGTPYESTLPYIGQTWDESFLGTLATQRCGDLVGGLRTSCLLGHRNPRLLNSSTEELLDEGNSLYDPEFLDARTEAYQFRDDYINFSSSNYTVYYTADVKRYLAKGYPLTLGIEFFYGAWNHNKATEFGIGREASNWNQGIVGYPERASVDYKVSKENAAGHSILIVGYDDEKIVTTNVLMQDGSTKTFTYKGVYYFKNSWGKGGFGRDFKIKGENFDGYGMITQKHAHEHGSFYRMPLK
ncbi:MAG: hypothetical protein ACJAT2_000506 [Bacteriovoracaceae bacterium]|jgi:hypothetical protein